MSNKPILFFSNDCVYSKQFLNTLSKYNFINIEPISIDPNEKKIRPKIFYDVQQYLQYKITKVPTVVLLGPDKYAISGDEAFKWLKYTINKHLQQIPKKSIQEYNPNEMSNFSDSYAKYGSTDIHDTSEQSFQFFKNGELVTERICTLPEEGFSNVDLKQKEYERNINIDIQRPNSTPQFQDNYNNNNQPNNQQNTNYNPNINIPKQTIDFSNPNLGFSSNYQNNTFQSKSQKSKEIDNRLENLLAQRDSINPQQRPSINPNNINWTTGEIIQ